MIHVAHPSLVGDGAAIVAVVAAVPASSSPMPSLNRRWAIAIIFAAALASAVSFAIFRPGNAIHVSRLHNRNVAQQLGDGAATFGRSVASLLGLRSPGERAVGALAILKHKRAPVLTERALPKVRHQSVVARPLAASAPPATSQDTLLAPPTPLYNILSRPPEGAPISVAAGTLPSSILPGATGVFIGSPPSPGSPGLPVTPGNPTTPTTPGTPGTTDIPSNPGAPGVPEPGTWAMMLLGFLLIGTVAGHERRIALRPATN